MSEPVLRFELLELRLKRAFTTSRASTNGKTTLIARCHDGIGEGSSSIHYGVPEAELLVGLNELLRKMPETNTDDDIERFVGTLPHYFSVARCAVEMAYLDYQARREGKPLWSHLKLPEPREVVSSVTITRGDRDETKQQVEQYLGFRAFKVKVGFERDLDFVDEILRLRDVRLRLDANGGWAVNEAIERLRQLRGYPIDFIEQPIALPSVRDLDRIKTKVDATIFLDEDIRIIDDIDRFHQVIDGVNLKLSKCGGLSTTIAMAQHAREHGLRLMIGCMLESSVAITAGAHLGALFDFFDLDSILLIENDPFWGAHFEGDKLLLPSGAGIGISREENHYA